MARFSWSAVFAGSTVAVTVLMLLGALGSATATSILQRGPLQSAEMVPGTVIVTSIALFVGGWSMSQCIKRESKLEATFYALVQWGVIFVACLVLSQVADIDTGFNRVMGISSLQRLGGVVSDAQINRLNDDLGLTPDQEITLMNDLSGGMAPASAGGSLWLEFAGTAVSLAALVLGAIAGAMPRLSLKGQVLGHGAQSRYAGFARP